MYRQAGFSGYRLQKKQNERVAGYVSGIVRGKKDRGRCTPAACLIAYGADAFGYYLDERMAFTTWSDLSFENCAYSLVSTP